MTCDLTSDIIARVALYCQPELVRVFIKTNKYIKEYIDNNYNCDVVEYQKLLSSGKNILFKRPMSYGFCYRYMVFENYLIQFNDGGVDVTIIDLTTGLTIYTISAKLNVKGHPNSLQIIKYNGDLYLEMHENVCWEYEIPSLFKGSMFIKLEQHGKYQVYTRTSTEYKSLMSMTKHNIVASYSSVYTLYVSINGVRYSVVRHEVKTESDKLYYLLFKKII